MARNAVADPALPRCDRCAPGGCFRSCTADACDIRGVGSPVSFAAAFCWLFAGGGPTELRWQNLPVLIVSAMVVDRVGRGPMGPDPRGCRVVTGAVRAMWRRCRWRPNSGLRLCCRRQGAKAQHLYARGSVFVTLLASLVISGYCCSSAGLLRALDPRRHSLRPVADDDAADRHRRHRTSRSWRSALPITAIAANCWRKPRGCN